MESNDGRKSCAAAETGGNAVASGTGALELGRTILSARELIISSQWPQNHTRGNQPIPSLAGNVWHNNPCFVDYKLYFRVGKQYAGRPADFVSLLPEVY